MMSHFSGEHSHPAPDRQSSQYNRPNCFTAYAGLVPALRNASGLLHAGITMDWWMSRGCQSLPALTAPQSSLQLLRLPERTTSWAATRAQQRTIAA